MPSFPSAPSSKSKGKKGKQDSSEIAISGSDARVNAVKAKRKRTAVNGDVTEDQHSIETRLKKKKTKRQHQQHQLQPLQNDVVPQISPSDFLSAIIAAATAPSSDQQQPSAGSSFNSSAMQAADVLHGDISTEAVLRVLQDVDFSDIAQVLKVWQDPEQGPPASLSGLTLSNGSISPNLLSQLVLQAPPPVGQVPVSAGRILNTKPTETASGPTYEHEIIENYNTEEDALLLSTKWLSTSKLVELSKSRALVYKKGKFSAIEEEQLKNAIERYASAKQLTPDQLNEVIFPKEDKLKDNQFWSEITRAVPQRPIISVYHHVRRTRHPLKAQGKWLPAEDQKLKEAVAALGQYWEKVSLVVGRRAPDCRDRWRNHIVGRDIRVNGPWTQEEEEELTRIVEEMTVKKGGTLDDDVFWGTVSDHMGNRRNRQQCHIKWTDALSKRVKLNGNKPRWSNQDSYILVHKLDSLRVRDDTEIDWKTLADDDWNIWSAHVLQRRWLSMKRSVKGYEEMPIQELMEILKAKKANFDSTPNKVKRKSSKKYPSAETIDNSDEEEDEDEDEDD
ncbi:hypothetical protein F5050DRAFT_1721546 [Lentinula boryana]|uniref:Nucleolar protein n=1 Tax=Lentinula boryana TaxID=40481 RepID=A0ABQ8QTT6_9AGAR|nr:hypothetical protein F5050DRAFT_1721546 [Lentinula boryana]